MYIHPITNSSALPIHVWHSPEYVTYYIQNITTLSCPTLKQLVLRKCTFLLSLCLKILVFFLQLDCVDVLSKPMHKSKVDNDGVYEVTKMLIRNGNEKGRVPTELYLNLSQFPLQSVLPVRQNDKKKTQCEVYNKRTVWLTDGQTDTQTITRMDG